MTARRRAALLLGLGTLLGGLAATDVAHREAALRDALGPVVPVVVARQDVAAGARLTAAHLAVRTVPERYAPAVRYSSPRALDGLRAAVAIPARTDVIPAVLEAGQHDQRPSMALRPGQRVAEIVALGSPGLVVPGGRVDVLVTRERADGSGVTSLALEDAEVLAAAPAPDAARSGEAGSRVAVSLLVTVRQAVYLAAAQAFARDLRVLPRAPGDRRHGTAGISVGSRLG